MSQYQITLDQALLERLFQTDKGPQRKHDVVLLRYRRTRLAFLHRAALLERSVIGLGRVSLPRQLLAFWFGHGEIVRHPVIRFVKVGHEHFDHSVAFEMHDPAFLADLDVLNSSVARIVWIDLTIRLQTRQPAPVEHAEVLEIVQTAVPIMTPRIRTVF